MPSSSSDLFELYRAGGLPEAHALHALLEAEGITARIENEPLQTAAGGLALGWTISPRVMASRADEEAAQAILAEFVQRSAVASAQRGLHCLACGQTMGQASVCANCGWTYQAVPSEPHDAEQRDRDEDSSENDDADAETDAQELWPAITPSLLPKSTLRWEIAAVLAIGIAPNWVGGIYQLCHPASPAPYWLDSLWLISQSACIILVTLHLIVRSGDPLNQFGITRPGKLDVLLAGVMLLVAESSTLLASMLVGYVNYPATESPFPVAESPADYLLMGAKYLFSGHSEELVCRCYLIARLRYLFQSNGWAVLVAAFLFSSCHIYQGLPGMTSSLFVGLAYGTCFLLIGRIWPLALGHALFNMRLDLLPS